MSARHEHKSTPIKPSLHKTFREFLDCVRTLSVSERRASLEGLSWMAGPPRPCPEIDIVDGKEALKYVWDHLAEFETREALQTFLSERLEEGQLIANAVRSCMVEHCEEDDRQLKEGPRQDQGEKPPADWKTLLDSKPTFNKTEASAILQCDRKTITAMVDKGHLKTTSDGKRITQKSIELYITKGRQLR